MAAETKPLLSFGEGLWLRDAPVSFLGLRLTTTMVVLRLADSSLVVYSPVTLTSETRAAVESHGRVAHLYVPNLQHQLCIGEWAAAFPAARVHAPPGLRKKRPELRIDRVHGESLEPAFAGAIDEIPIAGFRLQETALFYRPAQAMVVADLVHNVGRPTHAWTRTYARAMGFYDRIGLSRAIRWTAFNDRKAARRSIDELLGHRFDRLVVGHGAPITTGGREAVAASYAWLRAS